MARNVDLKLNERRSKVYLLYATGNLTKKAIAEKLHTSETTIDRDLEAIRREMTFTETVIPETINWDNVRKEALDSLRAEKILLLQAHEESSGKPWTQARILAIMKDIDVRILERVAQPPQTRIDIKMIKQDALTVVSFLTEKHPELIPSFKEFIRQARLRGLEKKTQDLKEEETAGIEVEQGN